MSLGSSNIVKPPLVGVRGWLAFLCIILMVIQPLMAVFTYGSAKGEMERLKDFNPEAARILEPMTSGALTITAVQVAFGMVAGLLLVSRAKHAVAVTKLFLICTPLAAALQLALVPEGLPDTVTTMIKGAIIGDIIRSSLWCLLWFIYLCRSRRVRDTYSPEGRMEETRV
jgi:hypothetical protein